MNRYLVERRAEGICSWLLDERNLALEARLDSGETSLIPGTILTVRVRDVVPAVGAAFVSADKDTVCFLPLQEAERAFFVHKGSSVRLQQGDELIVQVTRPAIGTKAPSVTAELSLQGFLTVIRTAGEPGVSRKVGAGTRDALRLLAEELSDGPFSCLLRTNAESAAISDIRAEAERQKEKLSSVIESGRHSLYGTVLYRPPSAWAARLSSLRQSELEEILTDDPELFSQMTAYAESFAPSLLPCMRLYKDQGWSMRDAYRLDRALSDASSSKVYLKSGAFLVIDRTEAMSVIDVNSGKMVFKKHTPRDESLLKVNLEAAGECARQIRLRNLTGIIMIDFINMEEEAHRQQLLEALREKCAADPVRTVVVDLTKLQIAEITRQKNGPAFSLKSR